jgi:hypothetical protein
MANSLLNGNKVLSYPKGLAANETDGRGAPVQYMLFKINDSVRSQKLKGDTAAGDVLITDMRDGTGTKAELGSEGVASKNADPALSIMYDSAAVQKERWRTQKGMKRLDRAIVLPMPNEHTVGSSVDYDVGREQSMLTAAVDNLSQLSQADGAWGELATLGINKGIGAFLNTLKSGLSSERDLLAEERLARNPKKEVMFKGIGYRQFSFRYQFAPKSFEESQEVNRIIETFRYYQLPEISAGKYFYTFPAEFEIAFIRGTKNNPNIPKIATSVLNRVGINYSPNSSSWATLPNGAPVAIDMTLDFTEVVVIDRTRVWNKDSEITSGY